VTPNLGEFLLPITASRRRWGDVAGPFMRKVLDRNVRWLLNARPHLAGSGVDGAARLAESFHGSFDVLPPADVLGAHRQTRCHHRGSGRWGTMSHGRPEYPCEMRGMSLDPIPR
jgi:hypothetical protein